MTEAVGGDGTVDADLQRGFQSEDDDYEDDNNEEEELETHKEPIKWDNFSGEDEEDNDYNEENIDLDIGGEDNGINWKQQPPFFFQRLDSDEVIHDIKCIYVV